MKIAVHLAFHEGGAVRLLNWLAGENARILRARPDLPGLYESGVTYVREQDESWPDYLNMLAQGHDDCDGLAAARAGELLGRGWRALAPDEPGYDAARQRRLKSIKAQVFLKTRSEPGSPGLYHCLVRYRIGRQTFVDDPSARLGMSGPIDPSVRARWTREINPSRWRTA